MTQLPQSLQSGGVLAACRDSGLIGQGGARMLVTFKAFPKTALSEISVGSQI